MVLNSGKHVAGRGFLALVAGYAVTGAWTAALARVLPLSRIDASLIATMLSFLIYAGIVVWAFAARSIRTVATALLIAGLLGYALFEVAR